MFFSRLPNLEYSASRRTFQFTDQDFVVAKNIFKSYSLTRGLNATNLFFEAQLEDGDRPEYVSQRYYNNPFYDWAVLLFNNVKNVEEDWYMDNEKFEKYMYKKYTDPWAIRHWITKELKNAEGEIVQPKGIIVYYDENDVNSYSKRYIRTYDDGQGQIVEVIAKGLDAVEPVTHWEHESYLNDEKSRIQLIDPRFIEDFAQLFEVSVGYKTNAYLTSNKLKKTLNDGNIFSNISV